MPHAFCRYDNDDKRQIICSCYVYVMAGHPGSRWFLKRWHDHTSAGSGLNQPTLAKALEDALNPEEFGSYDFTHLIIPDRVFPSGFNWDRFNRTAHWIHANWRVGRQEKESFLRDRGGWLLGEDTYNYTAPCG